MTLRPFALFALCILLLTACEKAETSSTAKSGIQISSDPAPLNVPQPLRIGELEIQVEIALNISEQSTGLMHRESMPENHGMIFVYGKPQQMSFWMKNTLIPLDIGYIDAAGRLTEVVRMYPKDLSAKRSQSDQIQFALEMNQGWYSNNGVLPGAQFELDSLRRAIAARGVDPSDYGL
jgi:uncharacterized membrane protein (UPF0127 family)|tara:strand:- start:99615 stop:100148 length:534 start_codon:yes stop_codon:yes gene_type:complete